MSPDGWVCPTCNGEGEGWFEDEGHVLCPMCEGEGVVEAQERPRDLASERWVEMQHHHWAAMARALGIPEALEEEEEARRVDPITIIRRYIDQSYEGPRPSALERKQAVAALAILHAERTVQDAARRARKEARHG